MYQNFPRTCNRRQYISRAALFCFIFVLPIPNYAIERYEIVDLGSLTGDGGFSQAWGLNNHGQVIGDSYINGRAHGFFWDDGVLIDIGMLPGFEVTYTRDLNDLGHVVGVSATLPTANPYGSQQYIWRNGVIEELPNLPGANSCFPVSINNAGQIVGNCYFQPTAMTSGTYKAYLIDGTSIIELPKTPKGENWGATDINESGQIAGQANFNFVESETIFIYHNGTFTYLPHLPESTGVSGRLSVNNLGNVAGTTRIIGGQRAVLYSPNGIISLGILPGPGFTPNYSVAYSLNDLGQVVGDGSPTFDPGFNAFIWNMEHGIRLLHDLVVDSDPLKASMRFQEAHDINNLGQVIIPNGLFHDGRTHGILLNPVSGTSNTRQVPTLTMYASILFAAFLSLLVVRSFRTQ